MNINSVFVAKVVNTIALLAIIFIYFTQVGSDGSLEDLLIFFLALVLINRFVMLSYDVSKMSERRPHQKRYCSRPTTLQM